MVPVFKGNNKTTCATGMFLMFIVKLCSCLEKKKDDIFFWIGSHRGVLRHGAETGEQMGKK